MNDSIKSLENHTIQIDRSDEVDESMRKFQEIMTANDQDK